MARRRCAALPSPGLSNCGARNAAPRWSPSRRRIEREAICHDPNPLAGARDLHDDHVPHTRYIVVQHKAEWLVKVGDDEYGPYHNQAEAMLFASWANEAAKTHDS